MNSNFFFAKTKKNSKKGLTIFRGGVIYYQQYRMKGFSRVWRNSRGSIIRLCYHTNFGRDFLIMNLTFDLQLFDAVTNLTVKGGILGGDHTYTISNVTLGSAASGGASVASLYYNSAAPFDFQGTLDGTATAGAHLIFSVPADKNTVDGATLNGAGSYTWEISTTTLETVQAGAKSKISLLKTHSSEFGINFDSVGGQTLNFANGPFTVAVTTTGSGDDKDVLGGNVAVTGGKSNVSLLSGSSLTGASVIGSANEVVSLATNNGKSNILNLKGSESEAFVTIGGATGSSVQSSSLVGFSKITFSGGAGKDGIDLDGIKDSSVLITGGADTDEIKIGTDIKRSSVSINGGKGVDKITLSGAGSEILVLNDTVASAGDTVTGWAMSAGDVDKGNTISIKGGMETFFVKSASKSAAVIGQGTTSTEGSEAVKNEVATTLNASSVAANATEGFGVNIQASDDKYSALLFGNAAFSSLQGTKFDEFNYLIADEKKTLNLGSAKKNVVVLANSVDEKHWGDTNVYKNISTVISSSAGKSLIINGVENEAMAVEAKGKNDSIWGANNAVGDTVTLTAASNQVVFTGANDGLDSIIGYKFGTSASKANAVRFLDGVNYIAAEKGALTFGASSENAVVVKFDAAGVYSVGYGFGTEGDQYIAGVDASANGGKIAYGSDVSVYIGQGDNSYISVDSSAKDVKLGWDGGAGYVSIGGIDGAMAADGAVMIGTTDNAQSIAGSSRGASSISGGFVAEEWTDTNADTLVGGGVATRSTTFFVGAKMDKDEIQNLSSKDNIVFLGSKYEDLVNFKPEATDNSLSFKFSNGNVIDASLVTGKTMKNLTDVSLYFDDGTYIWNGSEFAKAE